MTYKTVLKEEDRTIKIKAVNAGTKDIIIPNQIMNLADRFVTLLENLNETQQKALENLNNMLNEED